MRTVISMLGILLISSLTTAHPDRGSRQTHPDVAMACEGSTLNLECRDKSKTIHVSRANYGRFSVTPCATDRDSSNWSLECMSTRSISIVTSICDDKPRCSIRVNNRLFGDPCPLTPKYLRVDYVCRPKIERIKYPHLTKTPSSLTTAFDDVTLTVTIDRNDTHRTTSTPYSANNVTYDKGGDSHGVQGRGGGWNNGKSKSVYNISYVGRTTEAVVIDSGKPMTSLKHEHQKPAVEVSTVNYNITTVEADVVEPTTALPEVPTTKKPKPTRRPVIPERVKKCPAVTKRDVKWPAKEAGATALMPCPNNVLAYNAIWRCGKDGRWRGEPDLSKCKSKQAKTLEQKMARAKKHATVELVEEVAFDMSRMSHQSDIYGGDLTSMMDVMEQVVNSVDYQVHNITEPKSVELVKNVNQAVMNTSNQLLSKSQENTWRDLPQNAQGETASKMIQSVEGSAFQLAQTVTKPEVIMKVELNIVLEVKVVDTKAKQIEDAVFPGKDQLEQETWKGNSIRLTGKTIKDLGIDGLAKLIFLTYNNLEQWMQPSRDDPGVVNASPELQGVDETNKAKESYKHVDKAKKEDVTGDEREKEAENAGESYNAVDKDDEFDNVAEAEDESDEANSTTIVNTKVISASVSGRKQIHNLTEPILYTLEHKSSQNVYNPTCSYWDYSERNRKGQWSSFGCKMVDTNTTHTTCSCEHMTNFAVLMDVHGTQISPSHAFGLALVTYLGCIISIVFLLLAFLTFQFIRTLRCDRNTIHKNLVLCLFIAEVIFLAGIAQYDTPVLCAIVAGLLHYFFLAAFSWMCLEGVQLYIMLIEVFEAEKSRVRYYYLAGYGIPAIIVAVTAAVDHRAYGTPYYCWLKIEGGFIWAFVGPVCVVMTVNIIMLSMAIYMMCKHAASTANWKMKQKSKFENIRDGIGMYRVKAGPQRVEPFKLLLSGDWSWIKGAVVLIVLLGLTWIFGFLYVDEHSIFIAYVFTILNTLQGLFIFIFHCAMNEKVRKEYKKIVRRTTWLPDCIRVRFGGAKPYTSSSPNQSTSSGNYLTKFFSNRRRKRSSVTTLPKSSSMTPSSTWHYHNMKANLANSSSHESAPLTSESAGGANGTLLQSAPPEDGYLEPVSIRIAPDNYPEYESINGDLSMIDASVVDSEFVSEYCRPSMGIDVDKYKIKPEKNRLSAVFNDRGVSESECSDGELFRMTDKEKILSEYEMKQPLMPKTESEQNLVNNLASQSPSTLRKNRKRMSSDSGSRGSPSLNNLNKELSDGSDEGVGLSTPNIKFKAGSMKDDGSESVKDNISQQSMPDIPQAVSALRSEEKAVEKLKKALSTSDDGLVLISHGKKITPRMSADTQAALDAHKYRLTSSDC